MSSSSSAPEPASVKAHEKASSATAPSGQNRFSPGTNCDTIGKVYLGDTVELLQWDKSGEWCRLLYGGGNNVGWVHGKYIIPSKQIMVCQRLLPMWPPHCGSL